MIVPDASAILELLLNTEAAKPVARRMFDSGESLHAPHLLDLEVAQVLCRYCALRKLSDHRAAQALADFADFPLTRYPHEPFLDRIWQLRRNLTAYDAAYVALAEALGAMLLTRDRALARAAPAGTRVTLL